MRIAQLILIAAFAAGACGGRMMEIGESSLPVPERGPYDSLGTNTDAPGNGPTRLRVDAETPEVVIVLEGVEPAGSDAELVLSVFDADIADEGKLFINDHGPVPLFGDQAAQSRNRRVSEIVISSPSYWWHEGANRLRFLYAGTTGFRLDAAAVRFVGDPEAGLPVQIGPQRNDVSVNIYLYEATGESARLTLVVNDPDIADEGEMFINDHGPIALFGEFAVDMNDDITLAWEIETPADWWHYGANQVRFVHNRTSGFRIEAAELIMLDQQPELPVEINTDAPEAKIAVPAFLPSGRDALLNLGVFDPDQPEEGELFINGNGPVSLFGEQGVAENDNAVSEVVFVTPVEWWNDGINELHFVHLGTMGFRIDAADVSFVD